MKESEARKILGLKPRANPRTRLMEFEGNLKRKQAFVDNSPSQETKTRLQKELDTYQKALGLMAKVSKVRQKRKHVGLIISLIVIALISTGLFEAYKDYQMELQVEAQEREQLYKKKLATQNQKRIDRLQEEGSIAIGNRKWVAAQESFDSILAIDPKSATAQAGFESIRLGKLEERNQKIFYILGNSQAALEAGRWDEATKLAQSVLDANPGHKDALQKLQQITQQRRTQELALKVRFVTKSLESGKLPEAQQALTALKKSAPSHARIPELSRRINEALAEIQAHQLKALELFKQAQTLDKGQFSAEAITLLDDARQLDPGNPEILSLHQKISSYTRTIQVPADYPTISAALAEARPRDRIQIAAGIYRESLVVEKGVRLEGSADGKTILELPAAEAPLITITATAKGTHISELTLQHIGFDLDDDRSSAVIIQGGDAILQSCHVNHAAGHGIAVIDGAQARIVGCQITESGWDGISVYGENDTRGSHADILSTTSQNNLHHGVEFWKGGSGSITDSRMLANGFCGILAMSQGTEVTIKTSLCARNRGAGILASDQVKAEITANRSDKNHLSGIVARGAGTIVSIINCVATSNQEVGILIHRDVTREAFSNNKASRNKKRQIWLDAKIKPSPIDP